MAVGSAHGEEGIVGMVQGRRDIEEVSSDSDDDEPEVVPPSIKDMIETCRKLEGTAFLSVQRVRSIL